MSRNSLTLTQLSMDDSNVNWLLRDLLEKQREQHELPKHLNIKIHGAFKIGFKSAESNIKKLMKALTLSYIMS